MEDLDKEFAYVAQQLIGQYKQGEVDRYARNLGVSRKALANRLGGRTKFSLSEAAALIGLVDRTELANLVLKESRFFAAPKVRSTSKLDESLRDAADIVVEEAAESLRAIRVALEDGRITHIEKPRVLKEIEEVAEALAALKETVESLP